MRTQTIEEVEYILNEDEKKVVLGCLNYCHHRIEAHGSKVFVNEEKLERLRDAFEVKGLGL